MLTRRSTLAALGAFAAAPAFAQDRLQRKRLRFNGRVIDYFVRTAGSAKAPMLLCFGGGDANEGIAEYYDQVYTPNAFYQDHHVILPIGPPRQLYFQFSNRDARAMVEGLTKAERVEGRGLVSGVSNGGRAAFRFAQAAPKAFRGIITMPGAIGASAPSALWKDYAVILAVGTLDARWITETQRAYSVLQGHVGAIEQVRLSGQGHVVNDNYDIDPIYARLKALEERLGR